MREDITFEFACRDDCLDQMVPSDLRALVVERDRLRGHVARLSEDLHEARAEAIRLRSAHFKEVSELRLVRDLLRGDLDQCGAVVKQARTLFGAVRLWWCLNRGGW